MFRNYNKCLLQKIITNVHTYIFFKLNITPYCELKIRPRLIGYTNLRNFDINFSNNDYN